MDDVAVNAPMWYAQPAAWYAGVTYVVTDVQPGASSLGSASFRMAAPARDLVHIARCVGGLGDVDKNGFADLMAAAQAPLEVGFLFLVYGPRSGFISTTDADAELRLPTGTDTRGDGCIGLGDIDADGHDDIGFDANYTEDSYYFGVTRVYMILGMGV
jgi:hypothetical protein